MSKGQDYLKTTFDRVAPLYDEARPGYPEELFDDVVALSGIPPGGRILEIGCGPGKATVPLARRGYRMLCIELGENLAALARKNLADYPGAQVRTGAFEDWEVEEDAFDLVVSASAFHWLDRAIAYPKIARALVPGGSLAVFWDRHVRGEAGEGFFEAVPEIYRREAPEIFSDSPLPSHDEVRGRTDDIEQTGLFDEVTVRKYRWDAEYDAVSYLRLLGTYSGHIALDDATRQRLFDGISRLIDESFGGRIVKSYTTVLYLARARRDGR